MLATGSVGKSWLYTSNSWESTGDGHAMAAWAGADLIDMEAVQFHPTGMVWPLSVRGILVTEGVRGDGGVLRNSEGRRFMFDYIPPMFAAETADTEEEADRWYEDHVNNRRPPELLPRDEVARSINSEVKAGRGSPHGGVFLDIATRRAPSTSASACPSMYHQFMELAGVDITAEAMEVGPTCHYMMGGVRVDADTERIDVPGLFAAGEVAGGMHGANRLGGNSLSDLLVFGRRAGMAAADYAERAAPARRRWTRRRWTRSWPRRSPLSGARAGRAPTTCTTACRRPCRASWASSAPSPSCAEALEELDKLDDRAQKLSVAGAGPTTRAGTSPPTCPPCSTVSRMVTNGRSQPQARAGEATPETTTRPPTPRSARSTSCSASTTPASYTLDPEPLSEMPAEPAELFVEEVH